MNRFTSSNLLNRAVVSLAFLAQFFASVAFALQPQAEWSRQWGSTQDDYPNALAFDGLSGLYISGSTGAYGVQDAFVTKFDTSGNLLWNRQLGTSADDGATGVAADVLGNVFVTGVTFGNLAGTLTGVSDVFVTKYNAAGTQVWTRQFGDRFLRDVGTDVAADGLGNVYVAGYGGISANGVGRVNGPYAFLRKYNSAGNLVWDRLLDSYHNDYGLGVSVDPSGNVYLAGETQGDLGRPTTGSVDFFVSRFTSGGTLQWTRQSDSFADEGAFSIAADGLGNVFFGGQTGVDGLVGLYSDSGVLQWTKKLTTPYYDEVSSVAVDGAGNAIVTGFTNGGKLGAQSFGGSDVFFAKYDDTGNRVWINQLGTLGIEEGRGVALDSSGFMYLAGRKSGAFIGPGVGGDDVFLIKFAEVPEPAALILIGTATIVFPIRRSRRHGRRASLPCDD